MQKMTYFNLRNNVQKGNFNNYISVVHYVVYQFYIYDGIVIKLFVFKSCDGC